MKLKKKRVIELLEQLEQIESEAKDLEKKYAKRLKKVHPANQKSALNLIHYLALRNQDIRELQDTLGQLIVTPLKPYQIIVGKLIPFIILGFAAVVIILTSMWVIFNIAVKGDIIFLFVASFLYILSTLGLGLLVSTISKTQQQAMMIAIFGVMMPMIFLSGFAFPIENMPEVIQYISYIIPLRYFNDIIRGVILKGIGISELWLEAVALLTIGVTILSLSSLRFSRRLE